VANERADSVFIIAAFQKGATVSTVIREFGCARQTAITYRKIASQRGLLPNTCHCGQPFGHHGWCDVYDALHPTANLKRSVAARGKKRRSAGGVARLIAKLHGIPLVVRRAYIRLARVI